MGDYNVKFIKYKDGTTQVRVYNDVIRHKKKSKKIKAVNKSMYKVVQVTFDELIAMVEKEEQEQRQREEYSIRSSVSRTRSKIEQLARSGEFQYFVTLTYSPQAVDRYDYNECIKKFTVWLNNIKRKAPNLQLLAIPEFHTKNAQITADGTSIYAVHLHCLMGHIEGLELEFYTTRGGQPVYKLLDWHFGISDVTMIQDNTAVSRYIRKYITKQSISIARTHKGRHRYFKTGLTLPKETTMLIDGSHKDALIEEYIDRYAADNNLAVCGCTTVLEHAYIPLKYIDLKP